MSAQPIFAFVVWIAAAPSPIDDRVAAQIVRLAPEQTKATRLDAIAKLRELRREMPRVAGLERSISKLTLCAQDKDAEVREKALTALAIIAHDYQKVCPNVLINAFFDANEDVRWAAINHHSVFQEYPQETIPLLIRALDHRANEVRSAAASTLGNTGSKTDFVLAALNKASQDKDPTTRNNAFVSLWKLDKNWDRHVRHLVRCAADANDVGELADDATDAQKRDRDSITLLGTMAREHLPRLARENPVEFSSALVKLFADVGPALRIQALKTLCSIAKEESKVKEIAASPQGQSHLRKLIRDPESKVRAEAAKAIDVLTCKPVSWPAEIANEITALEPDRPKEVRLDAITQLGRIRRHYQEYSEFAKAVPALTRLAEEKDMEIRDTAIMRLAIIERDLKHPCPIVIVRALLDKNYPTNAANMVQIFDEFPKEALPLFVQAAAHEDSFIRQVVFGPLAKTGGNTREVLKILEKATTDSDFGVRDQAENVLWTATKDIDRYLAHLLGLVQTWRKLQNSLMQQSDKLELEGPAAHGAFLRLQLLGVERPREVAPIFTRFLGDKSPVVRLHAIDCLEYMIQKNTANVRAELKRADAETAIRIAAGDKDLEIRQRALTVLCFLRDEWDPYVRYLLAKTDEWRQLLAKPEETTPDARKKRDDESHALFVDGLYRLIRLAERTPAPLASVLIKLVADESAFVRQCAADGLGTMAEKNPDAVKTILKDLNAEAALRELLDDTDFSVRFAAEWSLKKFAKR